MQEYIVTVADPKVWDTLWIDLIASSNTANIPQRPIEVINERPFNDYCAHFNLTEAEADTIKSDPRVIDVELQADLQVDVFKEHSGTRTADYNRNDSLTMVAMRNWGLYRCISTTNQYAPNTSMVVACPYNLDGSGVDIVIVDSGVDPNHPEFAVNADGTGGSRVVDFDWSTLGVPGVVAGSTIGGYLGDSDGHGTNCASIAAGNTCGWAPGAAIYSLRIFAGTDITTGAALGALDSDYAYDLVKAFHLQKIANGNTRPTICSNSWAYNTTYTALVSTNWRGTTYTATATSVTYGQVSASHPYSITYVNASVDSCAAAGVIMVGAAGNTGHKIDVPGGQDYNNYYTYKYNNLNYTAYYHRGSSPTSASSMILVGAMGYISTAAQAIEGKPSFSSSGPRVDLYAPGTMIMGAYGNKAYATPAVADPRKPGFYLNKVTGTSQAAPQVTGVLACLLQSRPMTTTAEAKGFLIDYSAKNVLDEAYWNYPNGTTYGNVFALQGGTNRILYQPFSSANRGSMVS